MDERVRGFLEANHAATMTAIRPDGTPHVAHIAVALVDGQLWSSETRRRMRTHYLRLDPQCLLLVFPAGPGGSVRYHLGRPGSRYLALETEVTILEGPEAPDLNVEFFKVLQPHAAPGRLFWRGQQRTYAEFRQFMCDEDRVIHQFEVKRAYGSY